MRGQTHSTSSMLCLLNPSSLVPQEHPLRAIKRLCDEALSSMSPLLSSMYAPVGRASVPPEVLLKAKLLMALFSIRSERQLCEQLQYNLLFRWFLDLDMLGDTFDHSTLSKNQERLLAHDAAGQFFACIVQQAKVQRLMSEEHFSVDGTLFEAWASLKSFRPKDEDDSDSNRWSDFKGSRRKNDTHESKTDPEAKLYRKGNGQEAKLCFSGHALMENRNGLVVDVRVLEANGRAEREAALQMLDEAGIGSTGRATLGADKSYDAREFFGELRKRRVTPHVAAQRRRYGRSAVDGRTTRHRGFHTSQIVRRRVEQIFGWMKTAGGLRRSRFRGIQRTQMAAFLVGAAYNLMRIARLSPMPP